MTKDVSLGKLGTIPLSKDILKKANIGLWAFEIDEGKEPRMYVDEPMMKLIGLEHQVSPEETYHAWYDHVDEASYGYVTDSVEKMTNGEHSEVIYPWHHPDGRTMIVRCGGVRNFGYTQGVRIEGTHQDITKVLAYDEEKEKNLQRMVEEQRAFTTFFLDTYVSAYYVNLKDYSCQIYKRTEALEEAYPINNDYIASLNDYIAHDVHPDDRAALLALVEPEVMRKKLEEKPDFTHSFRDISGGVEKTYRIQVIRGADKDHAAFGFVDITDEINDQHNRLKALDENRSLVDSFVKSYDVAYRLNLSTGEFDYLKATTTGKAAKLKYKDFDKSKDIFLNKYVYHGDKEYLSKELSIKNIRKKLAVSSPYSVEYRNFVNGELSWNQMVVLDLGNDEVALGSAEKSRDILFNRLNKMMLDDVFALLVVDIDENLIKCEIESPWYKTLKKGEVRVYSDAMKKFAKKLDGEAADFFNRIANIDIVKKELSKEDKRTFVYKSANIGGDHWVSLATYVVQRHEDGTPEIFTLQFSLMDTLSADKAELQKKLSQALIDAQEANIKLTEQKNLVEYFMASYASAFSVDLTNDTYEILHLSHEYLNLVPESGSREDMQKFIETHVHPDDRELIFDITAPGFVPKRLKKENSFTFTVREVYGGDTRTMRGLIIRGADEYHIAVGFLDISEELRKENESKKRLQEALAMSQSANRAKTTFLNNMSHDIRTPMNAIIGYTGLAASHIDNKVQVQDYLSKISQSSDHLLSLINDVLDMSRIESGKMNLSEKDEKLSDIIHTLRDIVQSDVKSKQLDFYVDAVDVNDEAIICDKLRLNQVLLNVVSNAVKYTPAGGTVALRVKETAIKKSGYATYQFTVKDNGMGMTPEFLKTIYDPFTRVKSSTVSGIQGTGLGMAITKNIVDMMGGSIEITSVPNSGTEVVITFDFKLQSAPKEPEEIAELKGVRGLVVDDDSNTCMSVANMLRDIGMRPEWCTSGKEAVVRAGEAHRIGDTFNVYIIDWLMPDMNGIETCRRIRKVIGKDAPIVILTAYDWSDIEEEAMEAGVTAFVSKPLFPSDLRRVLNKCLGKEEDKRKLRKTNYDFTGRKVLLVEDNELNREIATEILSEYGFVVEVASDGSDAVNKMKKAKPGAYDVILMDVQMPVMNGYEATKQIRALKTDVSWIPIIAMTANAFEEDRQAAIDSGMNAHVAKPIDVGELERTLAKFLIKS